MKTEVGHGLLWGFNLSVTIITCLAMLLYLLLFFSSRYVWTWPLGACFRTSRCGSSSWIESAHPSSLVSSGMQTQLCLPAPAKITSSTWSHCSAALFTHKYDKQILALNQQLLCSPGRPKGKIISCFSLNQHGQTSLWRSFTS